MVKSVMGLGRSGLQDWWLQRASAILILIFIEILDIHYLYHNGFNYDHWSALFASPWMKITTSVALASILVHAWIGLWTVTTDYLKFLWLRITTQFLINLFLILQLIYGLVIVWGR